MILKSIEVQNFRSILHETLDCEQLTALVGANGCGKSSFLHSLDLFYAGNPRVEADDFYNRDVTRDIQITLTYSGLDAEERRFFTSYVDSGELSVTRTLSIEDPKRSGRLFGSTLQIPEFVPIRSASSATELRTLYNELRQTKEFSSLPLVRSKDDALTAMSEWEAAHPENCIRQADDGQFFGFTQVARGYLGRYTRYIHISAVRDASEDASEGKGSPISELMDLVVRNALAEREDIQGFKNDAQEKYDELFSMENLTEVEELAGELTETLKTYVPGAQVSVEWEEGGAIEIPLPRAKVDLVEDGYLCPVGRTGHGLQRAFIFTLLQHLALARIPVDTLQSSEEVKNNENRSPRIPDLILGIEEPELYQHPNRQRHFAKVLLELASGAIPGAVNRSQVLYCTHSPLFVGIDRFNEVRLLRKSLGDEGEPKFTTISRTSLDDVAEILWVANGSPAPKYTGESLRPRLQTLMTPWMSEGFFADVVVLVEGEEDRAAILGAAGFLGHDLEAQGFSVLPCQGKNNLDRPLVIFQKLGIPTYVVWDGDDPGGNKKQNRLLLKLHDQPEQDWPGLVGDSFACFKQNLGTTLRTEIGEEAYERLVGQVQKELGDARPDQAQKSPLAIQRLLELANAEGRRSNTLDEVVAKVIALKSPNL